MSLGESETEKRHAEEANIIDIKNRKSRLKATFPRYRYRLEYEISDEDSTRKMLQDSLDKVEDDMDKAVEIINELASFLGRCKRTEEMTKVAKEAEVIEEQYNETLRLFRNRVNRTKLKSDPVETVDISKDMWKQLKHVAIPVLYGETKHYETWKSAFMSFVDVGPARGEYKMLQLRQYLRGPVLRVIEDLGHSQVAYEVAKERLERRYGGHRRKINQYLERLERFPPINNVRNVLSLQQFADLMDIAVVKMKEIGIESDLGIGTLYVILQRKLPETMLPKYHRWIFEMSKTESVETLRDSVVQESEFQVIANETIHGFDKLHTSEKYPKSGNKAYFAQETFQKRSCKICNGNHGAWACAAFKQLTGSDRWAKAKEARLCFRCLGENHTGSVCKRGRLCGIDGCRSNHHRLLHVNESFDGQNDTKRTRELASNNEVNIPIHQNEQRVHSTVSGKHQQNIALRTVPVIISSGKKKLKINALLDDASTKTYLNSAIASELGVHAESKKVLVNMLNGTSEVLDTMPVMIQIESILGNTKLQLKRIQQIE